MTPDWSGVSPSTARTALRRLMAGYVAVAGSALLFPHRLPDWALLLALHALGLFLLLPPRPVRRLFRVARERWPRMVGGARDWYALAVMPFLYTEIAVLNRSVYGGRFFDEWIQVMEAGLFGGQPSMGLAEAFPYPPLSETLHFFYLSYYLIIFVPPLYLYVRGRKGDHQRMVFNLMLAFLAHYVFFIFFPVQGPRYLFPAPQGPVSEGLVFRLTHRVLQAGSSQGAAFPSSHVGVSVAQTAMAFLVWKPAAPWLGLATAGLALGAVYGGFHYGVDVLCGLLYGLTLFAVAPYLARRWGAHSPARDLPEEES